MPCSLQRPLDIPKALRRINTKCFPCDVHERPTARKATGKDGLRFVWNLRISLYQKHRVTKGGTERHRVPPSHPQAPLLPPPAQGACEDLQKPLGLPVESGPRQCVQTVPKTASPPHVGGAVKAPEGCLVTHVGGRLHFPQISLQEGESSVAADGV